MRKSKKKAMGGIIPKIRVDEERLERYVRAIERCRAKNPEITFAAWVRFACDQQATVDLSKRVREPVKTEG